MRKVYAMYFSPTGNTGRLVKAAAAEAAALLNAECEEFNFTLPMARGNNIEVTKDDLVFLGVPTYAGRVPNKIMPFIRDNLKGGGAAAVAMVTYGNRSFDESLKELALLMKENQFRVGGGGAFVCEHAFAEKLAAGRPNREDMEKAAELGRKAAEKFDEGLFDEEQEWQCSTVGAYYVPKGADGKPAVFLKAKPVTNLTKCDNCGICARKCPMGSIDFADCSKAEGICIKCQACIKGCPKGAKYFDDEAFLSHKKMLEANFAHPEKASEIYL